MATLEKLQEAVQAGDTAALDRVLGDYLLKGDPDEQYGVMEWFQEIGFIEEALQVVEHLQYLFPEETQLHIDRANLLIDADREDEALNELMEITPDDELYAQALVTLADLFQLQGLLEAAENRLDEAIGLMPNESLLQQAKAELLLDSGRYLESARIYQELEAKNIVIEGVDINERLAEVYSAGAAYEEALPHYERALKQESKPDVLFGAAFAAFQTKQYELSVKRLDELLAADADYFSAYLLKAQSFNMMEEYKQAYEAITQGLARDEFDKELYLFAGKLALKLGKDGEGVDLLRQAIALDPEYMEALYALMSYFHAEERDAELLELAHMAVESGNDWNALYPLIAQAYDRTEQFGRALEYYEKAHPAFSDDAGFLESYALFLVEEGKREQALEIIKQLQALEPENPQWFDWLESFD